MAKRTEEVAVFLLLSLRLSDGRRIYADVSPFCWLMDGPNLPGRLAPNHLLREAVLASTYISGAVIEKLKKKKGMLPFICGLMVKGRGPRRRAGKADGRQC